MDVIYRKGSATANEVLENMADPPSNSAIRALLRVLEVKGALKHKKEGIRFIYMPTKSPKAASRNAIKRIMWTYFNDSTKEAIEAILEVSGSKLSKDEREELAQMIKKGRR